MLEKISFRNSVRKNALAIGVVVLTTFGAGCGSSGSKTSASGNDGGNTNTLPQKVQTALNNAADPVKTFPLIAGTGSMKALRALMPVRFPESADLASGASQSRDAMLSSFTGTPAFGDDVKLAIFARSLEQMGDRTSLPVLTTFLQNNIAGDLWFTPNFIATAIRSLSNQPVKNDTLFYTPIEMQEIISQVSGATSLLKSVTSSPARPLNCYRQYILLDRDGKEITYADPASPTPKKALATGIEYASPTVPDETRQMFIADVSAGGGTYVTDDPVYSGTPSKQFNCAGYAFRILNGNRKWNADPGNLYSILVEKTGALVQVSDNQAQPGDKVFYFSPLSSTPFHVAEVRSVSGLLIKNITIRNADGQSGLWDAPIDAPYFANKDLLVHKIFRWANGTAPAVRVDPATDRNPAYCDSSWDSASFVADISIGGTPISFIPTTVVGSNQGTYDGTISLTGIPGIMALSGSGTSTSAVTLLLDKRQISAPGVYGFGQADKVFEQYVGSASLQFFGPQIKNADDGSNVGFESTGGSVTLTTFGTANGDHIIGSYLATVSGARDTGQTDRNGSHITETITGTISGHFDVEITQ